MAKEDVIVMRGIVVEVLPNTMFKVKLLDQPHQILTHLSGKMKKNNINVLLNDWVDVEVTPYDLTRGRITFRHKNKPE